MKYLIFSFSNIPLSCIAQEAEKTRLAEVWNRPMRERRRPHVQNDHDVLFNHRPDRRQGQVDEDMSRTRFGGGSGRGYNTARRGQ